jgi:hypothetical protein
MSYSKASEMRFLFFGTPEPTHKGLLNSDLRLTTEVFAWLSILFALPSIITNFNYIDEKSIPIIYVVYTVIEFMGPVLMFVGAVKQDFSLCFTGNFIYSIFTLLEMTVKLAFGLIMGLLILPTSVYPPVAAVAYTYLIVFLGVWLVFLFLRIYVNYIFFSFTKNLGLRSMYGERFIPSQRIIIHREEIPPVVDNVERNLSEEKIHQHTTVPVRVVERETNFNSDV